VNLNTASRDVLRSLAAGILQNSDAGIQPPSLANNGFEVFVSDDNVSMPRKIRQLIADLEKHGFVNRGGKGSHRNFLHPSGVRITLSGAPGDDAKHYQERDLKRAIQKIQS